MTVRFFSNDFFNQLSATATNSRRQRQHYNLHASYEELCQRFFNAIEPDTYIRPHRHDASQGVETLVAIRGAMALVVFSETGEVKHVQKLGVASMLAAEDVATVVEVEPGIWHTVISLEPGSLLLEVKAGPFNPDTPKYPASWAPEESSDESGEYLKWLKCFAVGLNV